MPSSSSSFKKMSHSPKKSSRKLERFLIGEHSHEEHHRLLLEESSASSTVTPTGCVAIYVGEEAQRFLVPTGFLSHPLFRMLLDKANDAFGLDHKKGLTVPCSIATFMEVMNAVEGCKGSFEFGKQLVEELF